MLGKHTKQITCSSTEFSEKDMIKRKLQDRSSRLSEIFITNHSKECSDNLTCVYETAFSERPQNLETVYTVYQHTPNLEKKQKPKLDSQRFWSRNFPLSELKRDNSDFLKSERIYSFSKANKEGKTNGDAARNDGCLSQ